MTDQETFDFVFKKIIEQGKQSMKSISLNYEICAYRGDGGAKCAAGWLIPYDKYTPDMEGNVFDERFCERYNLTFSNVELVKALQRAHDTSYGQYFLHNFKENMKQVAKNFNLEYKLS